MNGLEPTRTEIGVESLSEMGVSSKYVEVPHAAAPSEALAHQFLNEQLADILCTLNNREAKILQLRFGLEGGRQRTLEEIGTRYGVTRERIRQIESRALRKLSRPNRLKKLRGLT